MNSPLPAKPPLDQARLLQRIAELEQALEAQKANRADLELAEYKYRALFDHSGDSILIIDVDTGYILEANSTAARRLGYSMEALKQITIDAVEIIEVDNSGHMVYSWESSFSGTRVYECVYRHRNGSLIPVEVSSRVIAFAEQSVMLNVVRDISKRKQIEQERETLIGELRAFAHTVAHDLKNPIGVIMNYGEMLAEFGVSSEQEILQIGGAIKMGARKMAEIVEALLLLASVRALDEVPLSALPMEQIIGSARERLALLIVQRGATIRMPQAPMPVAWGYAP